MLKSKIELKTGLQLMALAAFVLTAPVVFSPLAAQSNTTPTSDEIIQQLEENEGMSFRGLVIEPPEAPTEVTTDDQGNTIAKDDQGNTFVTNQEGETVVIDVEGNTIAKDDQGNTIVTDVSGNETIVAPPSIDMKVTFQFNSDELTEDAETVLNNLGIALSSDQLKDARFMIAGHTDSVGSSSYNQQLSQRRAKSVRNYLMEKFDIRFSRLDVVGRGEEQLLLPNDPENGDNRRVQIMNIGS